jgi:hypothetical protein
MAVTFFLGFIGHWQEFACRGSSAEAGKYAGNDPL